LNQKGDTDNGAASYEHPEEAWMLVAVDNGTIAEGYAPSQPTEESYGKHRDRKYPI
jgi:hypothetical protein